jgi:asparagine synthase (glutamine-hydrolysing)
MLSGGLDSGSVACIAAKQLDAKNKRLKAFSSVPIAEYKDYLPKDLIADESEYVKSIVDMYNNIDLTYCRSENKNSVTDIDFFINILEQPHKLIENLFWYNQIVKSASESDCKVLLNGQGGNMTISSGYFMANILTMLKKAKIIKVIKEINGYSKLYNAPKKYITNAVIRAAIPYNFKKLVRKKTYKNIDVFEMTPVNKNLIAKWDLKKRLKEKGFYNYPIKQTDSNQMKKYIVDPIALSQIALIETKLSLAHGIVIRDPTNDKRVIEFCISLPDEQYVRYGKERFLIRRAMKNILPDKIRLNYEKRGRQSADWVQRLQPYWQNIYNKLEKTLKDDSISNYIDIDKVKKQLESVGKCINEECSQKVRMLLVTFIFSQFINEYSKIGS